MMIDTIHDIYESATDYIKQRLKLEVKTVSDYDLVRYSKYGRYGDRFYYNELLVEACQNELKQRYKGIVNFKGFPIFERYYTSVEEVERYLKNSNWYCYLQESGPKRTVIDSIFISPKLNHPIFQSEERCFEDKKSWTVQELFDKISSL